MAMAEYNWMKMMDQLRWKFSCGRLHVKRYLRVVRIEKVYGRKYEAGTNRGCWMICSNRRVQESKMKIKD
ncbi:hypothetical protein Ahy_A05g022160 isoform C [Arachis hypogaea]|uniref:Uncharacterized protein n=1 Tax=Arachis hypogaea TaxID=3818 RepID=A0A445CZU5_ARAHY|nr:hypothetical protein Ahy_A05g022160 isoform C [Arachis hypogaea]